MPSIKSSHLLLTALLAVTLCGCGDKNDKAVFSPEGGHPSDWTTAHKTSAKADLETCVECHGEDLKGGISKSDCTKCHPATLEAVSKHQLGWDDYAYARHKAFVNANGTSNCATAICHGVTLTGGNTAQSCSNCHPNVGGVYKKHPADWTSISSHKNYLTTPVAATCKTDRCHGSNGKGVFLSGPACDQCHLMK